MKVLELTNQECKYIKGSFETYYEDLQHLLFLRDNADTINNYNSVTCANKDMEKQINKLFDSEVF